MSNHARLAAFACVLAHETVLGTASARGVSFDDARRAAVTFAPDVALARLRGEVARADIDAAAAWSNPTLAVTTATQTARLGTSLSVPVPIFGQRLLATRAARADAETVARDADVVVRDARWGATLSWLDLWETERRAALLASAAADADRVLHIATEKFDAGSGSRIDVVRTGAARSSAAAEAESASRDARAAAARLVPWLGTDARGTLVASGDPSYPQTVAALDSLRAVLQSHPVLTRDAAARAAADAHVRSEERQAWPTVTPQITLNQFDPTLPGPDLVLGVSLDLPLLNQRGGEVGRARAEGAIARAQSTWDERRLGSELADAYERAEGGDAKLRALRASILPAISEAAKMTEEAYADGRVDLTRVLEAERALLDARVNEVTTVAQRGRALADLEHAAGVDLTRGAHVP
jgi:cobalt-zinc-cadmium efflux system outer membrane protein